MQTINVYTDGSCINNGKKNAKGGIGIYFPNKELKNISMSYPKHKICTNQKTELLAILIAIRYIKKHISNSNIIIHTDSKYSINSITHWAKKWIKTEFKGIKNTQFIIPIYNYYLKGNIKLLYVKAHTGLKDSNYYADKLATKGSNY